MGFFLVSASFAFEGSHLFYKKQLSKYCRVRVPEIFLVITSAHMEDILFM